MTARKPKIVPILDTLVYLPPLEAAHAALQRLIEGEGLLPAASQLRIMPLALLRMAGGVYSEAYNEAIDGAIYWQTQLLTGQQTEYMGAMLLTKLQLILKARETPDILDTLKLGEVRGKLRATSLYRRQQLKRKAV